MDENIGDGGARLIGSQLVEELMYTSWTVSKPARMRNLSKVAPRTLSSPELIFDEYAAHQSRNYGEWIRVCHLADMTDVQESTNNPVFTT
jgi:hypothetical protein